jgi:hypothetical protein
MIWLLMMDRLAEVALVHSLAAHERTTGKPGFIRRRWTMVRLQSQFRPPRRFDSRRACIT